MTVLDQVRLIVFRIHEKGLEVLMDTRSSTICTLKSQSLDTNHEDWIELDPIRNSNGELMKVVAIEGDYHDIPSIRALIKSDVHKVKGKIVEIIPELENGAYVAVKEAFKKVLPSEYAVLKELKDIIFDRNLVRNI